MAGGSLANLVVRLVGDGSSFNRMLSTANREAKTATSTISKETQQATSTADRALSQYGNEVKQVAKRNTELAHEVNVVQSAMQGQRVRVNSAGRAIDDYGRFVSNATMSLKDMGGAMQSVGMRMSFGITLPLTAAAAASVKLASDAEETGSKLNAVFSDMTQEANAAADSLARDFLMSNTEAKRLLGGTADLLTGFGFTQEAALGMSLQVQELAADLASFQNLEGGAAQASEALTKAMLGEREMAKMLGVAITEEGVQQEIAMLKAKGHTFATEQEAKAFATLQIALRQSKNAVGDLERTKNSFANQTRALAADLSGLATTIGQDLMPIARTLLGWARDAVAVFKAVPKPLRVLLEVVAGLTAAMGPLLFVGGSVLTMMASYKASLAMTGLTTKALVVSTLASAKAFIVQAAAATKSKVALIATAAATRAQAAAAGAAAIAAKAMAMGVLGSVSALWGSVVAFAASAKAALLAAAAWAAAKVSFLGTPLLIAGVAVAAYAAGVALRKAFGQTGIEDFNRELEKGRRLTDQLTERQNKQRNKILATANAIQDQGAKQKYLKEQIALAEKNQAGLRAQVQMSEKAVAQYDTTWKNLTGNKILEAEREGLRESEEALDRHGKHLQALRDAYNETGAGAAAAADQQLLLGIEADNLNTKYEQEIEMFGKTGREAEIYALKLKGATEEQLAAAQATHEKLLIMEKEAEAKAKAEQEAEQARRKAEQDEERARDAVRQTTDKLQEQIDTLGLSEGQLLDYTLRKDNATAAERLHAQALLETLQAKRQEEAIQGYLDNLQTETETLGMTNHELEIYKARQAGATAAQLEAMRVAQAENEAAKQHHSMMKEGQKLLDKYKDPQDKFIERQSELNTMLAAGAIDQRTYDKALEDARKALDDTAEAASQDFSVDLSPTGVDAVEAGTAEAMARLSEYMDTRNAVQGGVSGGGGAALAGGGGAGLPPVGAPPVGSSPAGNADHAQRVEDLLGRIADATEGLGTSLAPAGL